MGAEDKSAVRSLVSPGAPPREGRKLARGRIVARIWAVLTDEGAPIGPRLSDLYRDLRAGERKLFGELLCRSVTFHPEYREAIRRFLQDTGWMDRILRQTGSRIWWKRSAGARSLGDLGEEGAVGILTRLLEDPREEVRATAAYSLVQIGGPACLRALTKAATASKLGDSPDLSFLLYFVASHAPDLVLPLLENSRRTVRLAALSAVINTGCRQAAPFLVALLRNGDPETRSLAAKGVGRLRLGQARASLVGLLEDPSWHVRASAARALRDLRSKRRPPVSDGRSGPPRKLRRRAWPE